MPVSRQEVDGGLSQRQRERPQALDSIDHQPRPVRSSRLGDSDQISAVTMAIMDPTDGDDPRPAVDRLT